MREVTLLSGRNYYTSSRRYCIHFVNRGILDVKQSIKLSNGHLTSSSHSCWRPITSVLTILPGTEYTALTPMDQITVCVTGIMSWHIPTLIHRIAAENRVCVHEPLLLLRRHLQTAFPNWRDYGR